jgi:hypothetical protein
VWPSLGARRIQRDGQDADFIADIQKLNVELDPLPGERLQELIVRTLNVPQAVRERQARVRTIATLFETGISKKTTWPAGNRPRRYWG